MKAKRVAAVAVSAVLAATTVGALAGCGGNNGKTISVYLLANAQETAFYTRYFENMEQQLREEGYDYEIKFNGEQETNYYDGLRANIQGNSLPDIFYLRPNEIYQYKNNIASLQSYADTQTEVNLDDIYETALNMYRYNPSTGVLGNASDELYAFPKDLSTQQLGYYRPELEKYETLIKAKGYKMPWEMDFSTENYSWDDYKQICKIIADNAEDSHYASDIPPIEVLVASYGGSLIDLSNGRANGKVSSVAEGTPLYNAIKLQAELVDCGAVNYDATYAAFSANRVCFYGAVGSWEIAEYNRYLGEGNWGVMPWPTTDGSLNWKGLITSAGFVVSKSCANSAKGDIAKRIAISFMSSYAQDQLVRVEKISLPLRPSVEADFRSPENDSIYAPATRGVYLDVVSGEHGFFPAKYSTYDKIWLDELDKALLLVWDAGKGGAMQKFNTTDWANTQSRMQAQYDQTKNR